MCNAEVTLMDLEHDRGAALSTEVAIFRRNISFNSTKLATNHRYNATIRASNTANSTLSHVILSEFSAVLDTPSNLAMLHVLIIICRYTWTGKFLCNREWQCSNSQCSILKVLKC